MELGWEITLRVEVGISKEENTSGLLTNWRILGIMISQMREGNASWDSYDLSLSNK